MGEIERLVDFAGNAHDVLHTIPTHDRTCETARLERDILGQRVGKGLFRLLRERVVQP